MEDELVKSIKNLIKARNGQARILEAVIASIVIFLAFSAAFYFIYSSENIFAQETIDLNRLAHNVLHQIAESNVIEEILEEDPQNESAIRLEIVLRELLPSNIYFNLTIFNCTDNPFQLYDYDNPLPSISISNALDDAPAEVFAESGEVASASILYTSKRGNIYYLVLELTRAGL